METNDRITLTKTQQRRVHILTHLLAGDWSVEQAAAALQLSVRQVWRLKAAYQEHGAAAVVHGNHGRSASTRIPDDVRQRVIALVQGPYVGCNDSHLVDLLGLREGILLSRPSLRRILRDAGLAAIRQRRAPRHRRRRDREPQVGMLLQVDGSRHHWFGPDFPRGTLVGAIDDASSEVVWALFREQEDAQGYFLGLRHVVEHEGIPLALYHDRHGIFQREPNARWTLEEELAGRFQPTQFGAALEQLDIHSIAARSPQAKGRVERLWGTLQDRLVQELRLAGITTIPAANAFLPAFIARHNARFAVPPDDPGRAYRPLPPDLDLDVVLSFRYPRVVANDNTVQWAGQILQLPPGPNRRSYARAHVWVHELLDGSLGVRYQDAWILRTPPPAMAGPLRARKRTVARQPSPPVERPAVPAASQAEPGPPSSSRRPADNHPWRRGYKTMPPRRGR